jgi:site-specific recombinase XerC
LLTTAPLFAAILKGLLMSTRKEKTRPNAIKGQPGPQKGKRQSRGGGKFRGIALQARQRHAGDPHRQLNFILRNASIPAAFGRERTVSDKTLTDYGHELHRAISLLKACRMPIQNITDIGRKHVVALCKHWEAQGLEDKTINKYVSTLRRFLGLVGKFGAIPSGAEWHQILRDNGVTAGTRGCSLLPEFPKGWRDHGVDPDPIIAAIGIEEPVVAAQMQLQLEFGLRANESVQIIPADSDKGDHIMVWRGTKGGKGRRTNFSSNPEKRAAQRHALAKARELASLHPKRCLAIPGLSLRDMKNRMLYLARKHGVRRDDLGITLHGLRHQFASDLFTELTGLPAPVLQQVAPEEYQRNSDKVQAALLEISRQMGHERTPIVHAYTGSPAGECKRANQQLKAWSDILTGMTHEFQGVGAEEAWIVGPCAKGLPVPHDGRFTIAVRYPAEPPSTSPEYHLAGEILRSMHLPMAITAALHVPVELVRWTDPNPPADGFEIIFQ